MAVAGSLLPGNPKKRIRDSLRGVTWSDLFSAENAFPNLLRTLFAAGLLFVAHVLGSWLSKAIKRSSLEDDAVDGEAVYWTEADARAVRSSANGGKENGDEEEEDKRGASSKAAALGAGVAYVGTLVIAGVVVLVLFGVHIASLVALLSTLVVLVGLSLQGTISDVASGVILALFQTYDIGDVIRVDGVEGRVLDFRLVNTVLEELHTRALVTVPNNMIQSKPVSNLSRHRYHFFAFEIVVANTSFLADGKRLRFESVCHAVETSLASDAYPGIIRSPELPVRADVAGMDDAGTRIVVRVPMLTGPDLYVQRRRIMTGVRDVLACLGVQLRESDYSFLDADRDMTQKNSVGAPA